MKAFLQLSICFLFSLLAVQSQTLTTLVNFNGTNGAYAGFYNGLIQAKDDNFYGTTGSGNGTIFKMTPDGSLTTLTNFNGTNGNEFSASPTGLIEGSDGNFYGTTIYGPSSGDGTVFKITSAGTLTTLVIFNYTNGMNPWAALIQAKDGNFYGTTSEGGGTNGSGTIFKMTPDGSLTTLAIFFRTNGISPNSSLIQASDGNFYGTTPFGGDLSIANGRGDGTVFKMTPDGTLTTLTIFEGTNGASPYASLMQANDGNFYGTTSEGGDLSLNDGDGYGTVFRITPDGALTTLVIFDKTNGANAYGSLIQASDGNFYGTTLYGGDFSTNIGNGFGTVGYGTIFKMTPDGRLTTLFTLNGANGFFSERGLVQASDGNLYGTTIKGGDLSLNDGYGFGTIFKITGLNLLPSFQSISLTNGNVNLAWNSVSNWTYRVQYTTNLTDANWTDLPGDILATNAISVKADIAVSAERFYRLVLLR